MEKKPLYILDEPNLSPYGDYVKLYFNLSKGFNIMVIAITLVILIANIGFNIISPSYFNIIIYAFIGLILLLILTTTFLIPYLQYRNIQKKGNQEVIEFYEDSILVRYKKDDKEEINVIQYANIKRKKKSKKSYLLYQGKLGIILSKDNNYPEKVREQIEELFVKTKR